MPAYQLPTIRVPQEWIDAIDNRRGDQSMPAYLRSLILADLPKRVAKSLPEAGKSGRRWPDKEE